MKRNILGAVVVLVGLAAVAPADMLVPVALDCNANATMYFDVGDPLTDSGLNHAEVHYNPFPDIPGAPVISAIIDCISGTTDPAQIVGTAQSPGPGSYSVVNAAGDVVIGSAQDVPAGTALTLRVFGNKPTSADFSVVLKRGPDVLVTLNAPLQHTWDLTVPVFAGETLSLSTSIVGFTGVPGHYTVNLETTPEPATLVMLLLPALLRRRS